jgi:translocator protein
MTDQTRANLTDGLRAWTNLLLAITQVAAAPTLAALGIGDDIGTRSDQSPALFTPPNFTFAIWAVIYPAMIVYAIHSVLPSRLADPRLRQIGWWTASAMLWNTLWPIVTVIQGVSLATVVLIVLIFVSLLMAFLGLYRSGRPTVRENLSVVFPVSIFTAWLTVATIANTSSWLGNAGGFDGAGIEAGVWTAAMALVGGLLAALTIVRNSGNGFYAAVIVWALGGVAYKMSMLDEPIALAGAVAGASLVTLAYIVVRLRGRTASPLPAT